MAEFIFFTMAVLPVFWLVFMVLYWVLEPSSATLPIRKEEKRLYSYYFKKKLSITERIKKYLFIGLHAHSLFPVKGAVVAIFMLILFTTIKDYLR